MERKDKYRKLAEFDSERKFRHFLIGLLSMMNFEEIIHAHKQGRPEYGRDIVAKLSNNFDGNLWYAFVVKKGAIKGNTTVIEEIKDQINQAFEYPIFIPSTGTVKIDQVYVVTNEHFSGGAIEAISSSPKLKVLPGIKYWGNEKFVEHIDKYHPLFWDPGDILSKTYKSKFSSVISKETEITELFSTRLPEEKVKKLLDLFVKPIMHEIISKKNTSKASNSRKLSQITISIEDIIKSKDSFIIKGDPGSGKSRIINNIIKEILDSNDMISGNLIPVKISINKLRCCDLDIDNAINKVVKELLEIEDVNEYLESKNVVVFIDNIDSLYEQEMDLFKEGVRNHIVKGKL